MNFSNARILIYLLIFLNDSGVPPIVAVEDVVAYDLTVPFIEWASPFMGDPKIDPFTKGFLTKRLLLLDDSGPPLADLTETINGLEKIVEF